MLPDNRKTNEEQKAFHEKVARGKAVAIAREEGLEMIDEERLGFLLEDLENEGFIERKSLGNPAKRGIEILRG